MNAFQKAQLDAAVAGVPQSVRDQIAKEALGSQKVVLPLPYYSTARLASTRSGAGPFTYTIAASDRRMFQYGIGADASVAGFASGYMASAAETNLLKAGESLGNSDVYIYGMAVELCPNSEPLLAAQVWRDFWLELSLNGQDSVKLGTLNMFPGASGLSGEGRSLLKQPSLLEPGGNDEGVGPSFSVMSNGHPQAGNFFRFPQPFVWRAIGKGRDSNLAVILRSSRAVTATSASRAAVVGAAPGESGRVEAATAPADLAAGTFVDVRVRLVSISVGDRSINT